MQQMTPKKSMETQAKFLHKLKDEQTSLNEKDYTIEEIFY